MPNDPYFFTDNPPGFPGQWHLDKQTSGAAVDVNIRGAWNRGLTGQGVTIGIVEGAYQAVSHPELSANHSAAHSYNFEADSPNLISSNAHATAVAGLAAARGGNNQGITGAAPWATLAALRIGVRPVEPYNTQYDELMAAGLLYHSGGTGSDIQIKNHSYHPTPNFGYSLYAQWNNALISSAALGTINVFIAHNYRGSHGSGFIGFVANGIRDPGEPAADADTNKKTVLNLPEAVVVGAVNSDGTFASYSNFGANLFVMAPSGETGLLTITTTDSFGSQGFNGSNDLVPDSFPDEAYWSQGTGTSLSAPLVSGILALAKQAQPALDTRFAKHLLATTSRPLDLSDSTPMGGWRTNAAGLSFNNNYGFGLIDADALTAAAVQFSGVTPLITEMTANVSVGAALPNNDDAGVSRTFTLPDRGKLEEVQVHLSVNGASGFARGDVEAILRSPSGMESLLMYRNPLDYAYNLFSNPEPLDWTFISNAFWGENAQGVWTLTVRDVASGSETDYQTGIWQNFTVTARYGELIPITLQTPGDFNLDGFVDAADYVVWRKLAGQSGPDLAADGTGPAGVPDGVVDQFDFDLWRTHFGETLAAKALSSPNSITPEPGTMVLLAVAVLIVTTWFNKRFATRRL